MTVLSVPTQAFPKRKHTYIDYKQKTKRSLVIPHSTFNGEAVFVTEFDLGSHLGV